MNLKIHLTILLSFLPLVCLSQAIDNTAGFRGIKDSSWLRFSYDNDFFTADDKYYSQGINLEYFNSSFKANPLNNVLFHLKNAKQQYGLAAEHDVYTPNSIRHDEIIETERPYTAALFLKSMLISKVNRSRLSSTLSLGFFGKAALGDKMQKGIHKALDNIPPLGWQNQLNNDVIINYETDYDYELVNMKYFSAFYNSGLRIGTYNDKIQTGFTFLAGKTGDNVNSTSHFQFYIYNQSLVNFIAYDATLQGGMFNRNNPHTLSASEISNITFIDNYGIVFRFNTLYLEYLQSFLTKEYKTGVYHRWGGIKAGLIF